MIPPKIHYCWFGHNPKPELAQKCLESWKKHCPEYEIYEWNEDNMDLSACPLYVQEAYARKQWAFVTDYVRLKVVYGNGGIYLDTDVELLKPLDDLLNHAMFVGCEGTDHVNTGVGFGAEKGFGFLKENMEVYEKMNPINEDGRFSANPCPYYTTSLLEKKGVSFPITSVLTMDDGMVIYPNAYFNPYDWKMDRLKITSETYSIHHYDASWMPESQKKSLILEAKRRKIEKRFGKLAAKAYEFYFWSKKENGGPGVMARLLNKMGVSQSGKKG